MTNKQTQRLATLLPDGEPRYVRCYDNGESWDRYTVVYTGRYRGPSGQFQYVGMSAHPFRPNGFGQHGESQTQIDVVPGSWGGPSIGKRNHLGLRIPYTELPPDCKTLVLRDYREIWDLP